MLWGGNQAAGDAIVTSGAGLGYVSVSGTDGTNEGGAGLSEDDGALDMVAESFHHDTKGFRFWTPETPTLESEADTSFSGNNLRMSWTDIDTVAREYNYLILGPPPAGAAASLIYDPAPQRVLRSL
jgi:hypothetical protein